MWWLCLACLTCGSHPDWPEGGVPDRAWVHEALTWRLDRGVNSCPQTMAAIDAWTLEWIADSDEVHVVLDRSDWSFLNAHPDLLSILIQSEALQLMEAGSSDAVASVRRVRSVVRRSQGYVDGTSRRALRESLALAKNKTKKKTADAGL